MQHPGPARAWTEEQARRARLGGDRAKADRGFAHPDDQGLERAAFGITSLPNYRIRALLFADRPNWDLLATITPR
ncbi:MAG: hypothetical protein QY307_05285 [Acidimicrobiia bacterium]|nr:MAG: hypothetical protein QY307_05285 [Acidimicrobiia bacterium]